MLKAEAASLVATVLSNVYENWMMKEKPSISICEF
jgi:hypothetical protein